MMIPSTTTTIHRPAKTHLSELLVSNLSLSRTLERAKTE